MEEKLFLSSLLEHLTM